MDSLLVEAMLLEVHQNACKVAYELKQNGSSLNSCNLSSQAMYLLKCMNIFSFQTFNIKYMCKLIVTKKSFYTLQEELAKVQFLIAMAILQPSFSNNNKNISLIPSLYFKLKWSVSFRIRTLILPSRSYRAKYVMDLEVH